MSSQDLSHLHSTFMSIYMKVELMSDVNMNISLSSVLIPFIHVYSYIIMLYFIFKFEYFMNAVMADV